MGELSPEAFTEFLLPCLTEISSEVKSRHPDVPFFIFPKGAHYANN